jgi:anti-anti-sigma factor
VKEVDSSGLQVMLSFFEEVVRRKGRLEMVSISDSLIETIALAGLKRQFGL